MRIRSTKPEFWRSERIASVSWEHRFLLKGLESYVDDNGVGRDDLALIVGDLFQRDLVQDPSGLLRKVQEGLSALNEAGLVWRYKHDGAPLLYISFWETAQYVPKALNGRNPRPDGTFNYRDSDIGAFPQDSSGSLLNLPALNRGTEEQVTGEQRNRGTGSREVALLNVPFEDVWKTWPKKTDKDRAEKEYVKHARTVDDLPQSIAAFGAAYESTTEKQFIPALAAWLHRKRWTDELPQASAGQGSRVQAGMSVADELREMEGNYAGE